MRVNDDDDDDDERRGHALQLDLCAPTRSHTRKVFFGVHDCIGAFCSNGDHCDGSVRELKLVL